MDLIAQLRNNPYLGALSPEHIEDLAAACVVTPHAPGDTIFKEGERAQGVYLLIDGAVEVSRVTGGRVHLINTLQAGALFGVLALIEGTPRSASCTVTQAGEIAMIPKEAVGLLLNQSAPIAYAFQRALAAQMAHDLRRSDARLRELLAQATR